MPFPFQEEGEMQAAFATGNCGALAGDGTRLARDALPWRSMDKQARLLPETISEGPAGDGGSRSDDRQWAALVSWVMEALVQAEESGVTQANVQSKRRQADRDPLLRFLLGASREIWSPRWASMTIGWRK